MVPSYVFVAVATALVVRGDDDICHVRDAFDRVVASDHTAGILPSAPGPLPNFFRFVNLRTIRVLSACAVDTHLVENQTSFSLMEPFAEDCIIRVQVEGTVPGCHLTEFLIRYLAPGSPPVVVDRDYVVEERFPVPNGYRLNREGIRVLFDPSRDVQVRLSKAFDDVEVVRVDNHNVGTTTFDIVTTRVTYLMKSMNLSLIASDGTLDTVTSLQIVLGEGSIYPDVAFEKNFYRTTISTWDMEIGKDMYPPETINLRHRYPNQTFKLHHLNDHTLHFEVSNPEESQSVNLQLSQIPATSFLAPPEVIMLLETTATDPSGRQSRAVTTLHLQFFGNVSSCGSSPILIDTNSTEDLTIAVTVLSAVVILLLLILIYGYFKYVCTRKPQPTPGACKKCSNPKVKHRRPTPRRISEFPYPLDNLPPPLETLAETDVEEETEGKTLEVKVVPEKEAPKETEKARKRSMTFRESDEESRQNREALVEDHAKLAEERQKERKVSREGIRKVSSEEQDRRRRKSSAKMYHSMT